MNELIEFLTSKEIIVVYIVAAIACFLCFIIYLIDKNYYKRKQRHNTKELNKMVEEVNAIIEKDSEEKEVEIYETPILEVIEPEIKEVYTAKVGLTEGSEESTIAEVTETISQPEEVIENLEIDQTETLNVEDIVLETMSEESIQEQKDELSYTSAEPNRQQAQEELMRLTEELEKAEQEARNIDLTAYEEEQEENAIISLEELVRKSKEMYESNEYTQYEDEGNEPISIEDLERRMRKVEIEAKEINSDVPIIVETIEKEPTIIETVTETITQQPQQMVLDDFNTIKLTPELLMKEEPQEAPKIAYQSAKKFERSPVISPIYGIERKETQEEIELENTANYEKLDEEIKKTNEFLMTLRELQKNLEQ